MCFARTSLNRRPIQKYEQTDLYAHFLVFSDEIKMMKEHSFLYKRMSG